VSDGRSRPDHVYVSYIATTSDKLWQALTDGEFTRLYWGGGRVTSDWAIGSAVQWVREDGAIGWQGEVLVVERPRLLSYTFHMQLNEVHRAEAPSRLTFEIEDVGFAMKLTVTQDQFGPDSAAWETTRYGWPAIISSLKSLLETGQPLPFTRLGFGPSGTNPPH
jgi:uncharacterized protein YndB with AHSA1/START domain